MNFERRKIIGDKSATEKSKGEPEESRNEAHAEKIDDIFDELLDVVKDRPEAEREALKILIAQMRQVAEQIKQARDMKHLQEMKKLMLSHWEELNELAGRDPALVKAISKWGKRFVEEKVIFYDMMNEVKDELIDKSQEIQEAWNSMQVDIGKIAGWIGVGAEFDIREYLEPKEGVELDFDKETLGKKKKFATINDFVEALRQAVKGFDEEDIPVDKAAQFLERVNGLLRKLTMRIHEARGGKSVVDEHPEAEGTLRNLSEQSKVLSKAVAEASKIYKLTKKIRDTHFLRLYAE